MRLPVRAIVGNCAWTYTGEVFAVWQVDCPTYGHMPRRDQVGWLSQVKAACMVLPAEASILSICRPLPASAVREAMAANVDLTSRPTWRAVVEDTHRRLSGVPMYRRETYIVATLPQSSKAGRATMMGEAKVAEMARTFRIPPLPIRKSLADEAHRRADEVQSHLAGLLGAERVSAITGAALSWLYARAGARGVAEPVREEFPEPRVRVRGDRDPVLRGPSLANLRAPRLFEGGADDDEDRPSHRHYLRLDGRYGRSYQTFACLTDMPNDWTVPGGQGEVLAKLDDVDFPVDACVRIRPTENGPAQAAIRTKVGKLAHQHDEFERVAAGPPGTLPFAVERLTQQADLLAQDPGAPEYQVTFIFAVSADNLRDLESRADCLRVALGADNHRLDRPTGDQGRLWASMNPGAPLYGVCRDYTQYLLPADLAGCAPLTGSGLGDPIGPLLGEDWDSRLSAPVFFSPAYGPSMPKDSRSGSVAVVGQLRGGKSQTLKRMVWDNCVRGGVAVVTDRTRMEGVGEWVKVVAVMPPEVRTQVVRVGADETLNIDPALMFRGKDKARYTTAFFTLLSGTRARSTAGAVLSETVERVVGNGGRSVDVVDALLDWTGDREDANEARDLGRLLRATVRGSGLAQVAFGTGEPLRLDADYIVFHAPDLTLPTQQELDDPDSLIPDQIFSMALLYLINAVGRSVVFADRSRFGMIVVDEGYALTASPQGRQLLLDVGKNGPKENAGLVYATHLPSEIPKDLDDVFGAKFAFRMGPEHCAEALEWLGMEPTQRNIDLIATDRRRKGECIMRDRFGRHGLMWVVEPHTQALRDAFDTNAPPPVVTSAPAPVLAAVPTPPRKINGVNGHARKSRPRVVR